MDPTGREKNRRIDDPGEPAAPSDAADVVNTLEAESGSG